MNVSRYFNEALVKLEMETVIEPQGEEESLAKFQQRSKEAVLDELVNLLETGNRFGNHNKLIIDFVNRERKATTGIGHGVAIPHVRTMQAKEFIIAFARSTAGYEFEAMDGEPVHLFFIMAAPPYDDTLYLRIFKSLAEMLQYESFRNELMTLKSPGELIRALRSME
ncbi:MAG TPA: PTS sugar transporter subunit IIA [candidate division Zixibacteria bacterium]|nr:PTS sugar transporter subunit IIA [candidate division Zixibacteria bacterium]